MQIVSQVWSDVSPLTALNGSNASHTLVQKASPMLEWSRHSAGPNHEMKPIQSIYSNMVIKTEGFTSPWLCELDWASFHDKNKTQQIIHLFWRLDTGFSVDVQNTSMNHTTGWEVCSTCTILVSKINSMLVWLWMRFVDKEKNITNLCILII